MQNKKSEFPKDIYDLALELDLNKRVKIANRIAHKFYIKNTLSDFAVGFGLGGLFTASVCLYLLKIFTG